MATRWCGYEEQDFDESEFVAHEGGGGDVREHKDHPPRHLENGLEIHRNGKGGGSGGGGAGGLYGGGPLMAPKEDW
jgi:hypothetical protein